MHEKLTILGIGLLGGLLGGYLMTLITHGDYRLPASQTAATPDVLSAHRLRLLDNAGKTRAELALTGDGGVGLFFFDTQGRNRLVLGLYSTAEKENPFVVLNDTHQAAAGIFRVFGDHESPVIVLKNKGQDRSIYGLNPGSLEPFLVNVAADGKKTPLFGSF